jgi:hypothetical protein
LSSFFKAAEALAISSASMTPSPFASSAFMRGNGGRRPRIPGSPRGPASRGGGRSPSGGGASAGWAAVIQADEPSVNAAIMSLEMFFMLSFMVFALVGFDRPHRTRCSGVNGRSTSLFSFHK